MIELDKRIAEIEGYKAKIETHIRIDALISMCYAVIPPTKGWSHYSPSTDWNDLGPLIEKYGVLIAPHVSENGKVTSWKAGWQWPMTSNVDYQCDETPLIAACKAIITMSENK